jgi:uncharacterized protein with NAD-binding domain and iron-sulfur cluster
MSDNGRRQKIAILGGGMASLAAAFEITSQPGWRERYEVTLYQMGWRIGGKCASGRNPNLCGRIEEHGLHVWGGFYENAFRLIRQCYTELNRPANRPLATWDQAFKPHNFVVFEEQVKGAWQHWPRTLAPNDELPGEGHELLSLWAYLGMAIQWMTEAVRGSPYAAPAEPAEGASALPSWLHKFLHESEAVLAAIVSGVAGGVALIGAGAEHLLLEAAHAIVRGHEDDPQTHPEKAHEGLRWLLDEFRRRFERRVTADLANDDAARHLWILLDFFSAVIEGVLAHGVLWDGFSVLDDYDFSEWLEKNGASELTLNSAPLRAYYDYFFAYENGDLKKPKLSAGVALYHLMRLSFTYKKAIFWEMQAGMGDAVMAPLYAVLRRRGVKFRFFHRVESLGLSDDGRDIAAIRIARQATVKKGEYRPLIAVKGLPCWPNHPRYEQLVEGDDLQRGGIDLESPWSRWKDVETLTLRKGHEFDQIILGITLGPLKTICAELIAVSPAWRQMVEHLKTVQTLGVQMWLTRDRKELGWTMPAPLMTGYAQLLNTWGDFSHLLPREAWPAETAPRSLAYFCGPLPDALAIPEFSDHNFPEEEREGLKQLSVEWLKENMPYLLPATKAPGGGFDWSLLADPKGRQGPERFDAQYWRANISPAERYVLSVPRDWRYRFKKGRSGFGNLIVAGDWVYTGLGGCVEAAVMSGMMAARALTGHSQKIIGEVEAHQPGPLLPTQPPHLADRKLAKGLDDEVRAGAP